MGFNISVAGFEGPFDLLLRLVMKQKVDIGAVSVAGIADQYLAEVQRLGQVDLDVASDFLLVAATLLELKAAALVPEEEPVAQAGEGFEEGDLSAEELRSLLVERLVAYRQFKNAAAAMDARAEAQARMHPRNAGPDPSFAQVVPDYLAGLPLVTLAQICARLDGRRERVLLESEHIARKRIPLETRVEQVDAVVRARGRLTFAELLGDDPSAENLVVSLLSLLELDKREAVSLAQEEVFGPIVIEHVADAPAFVAATDAGGLSSEGTRDPGGGEAKDGEYQEVKTDA